MYFIFIQNYKYFCNKTSNNTCIYLTKLTTASLWKINTLKRKNKQKDMHCFKILNFENG